MFLNLKIWEAFILSKINTLKYPPLPWNVRWGKVGVFSQRMFLNRYNFETVRIRMFISTLWIYLDDLFGVAVKRGDFKSGVCSDDLYLPKFNND